MWSSALSRASGSAGVSVTPALPTERLLRQDVDRLADDRDRPLGEGAGQPIGERLGRRDRRRGLGPAAEIEGQIEAEVGGPGAGARPCPSVASTRRQPRAVSCSSRAIARRSAASASNGLTSSP